MGEHPLNILPYHVDLDIYVVTRLKVVEIGDFPGFRDDGDLEVSFRQDLQEPDGIYMFILKNLVNPVYSWLVNLPVSG